MNIDLSPFQRAEQYDASFALILSRAPGYPKHPDCFAWYDGPQLFLTRESFDVPYLVTALAHDNLATDGSDDHRSIWLVAQLTDAQAEAVRSDQLDIHDAFSGGPGHKVWAVMQYHNRDGAPAEAYEVPHDEIPSDWLPDRGFTVHS